MASTDTSSTRRPGMRLLRIGRHRLHRYVRRLTLSGRFLAVSVVVVAAAMLSLGAWIGSVVKTNITHGVATTAAASVGALIANAFDASGSDTQLTFEARKDLDRLLEIGGNPNGNRLLEVHVRSLDGKTLYVSPGAFVAPVDRTDMVAAKAPQTLQADIVSVSVAAKSPVPSHPITVLRIRTPVYTPGTNQIFALGELYFSAREVLERGRAAQRQVWILVALAGAALTGALYVFVSRASRTIADQRQRLKDNLEESRRLTEENRKLHATSERLRINANLANENLLVGVGSDIHDGPVQNLTLMILRLTGLQGHQAFKGSAQAEQLGDAITLATESIDELRNISAGLVLPELAELGLSDTIELAISRHEALSGAQIERRVHLDAAKASTEARICAYRVVQEGLANAHRHAPGARCQVSAKVREGELSLVISNQGGAPAYPQNAGTGSRMGLRGMRFRVEAVGGDLKINFGKHDTKVRARIPLVPAQ